ncbi:MAG: coproporphyrinogen dehydrogenase HemZ [Oscillospiraceae bacterium]|nr:coproporphyrinogen dehydrogenase HemZ [Oscillospiraceae bacterium]
MKLIIQGHTEQYAVEQLQMSLFPAQTIEGMGEAVSKLHRGKTWLTAVTEITIDGKKSRASRRLLASEETVSARRRCLQQSYYLAALSHLGEAPAWGALAGVRPTKLSTRHLLAGNSLSSAKRLMETVYFVSPARAQLAVDCSESTVAASRLLAPEDVSLYVGIPFCPTRCTYCSFVSRSIGKRTELLQPYLEALYRELEVTGRLLKESGKTIRSIYIGGGTPTTLSASQMTQLLAKIRESFDLSRCLEFTVEGGRPDTLTLEKLQAIRQGGADRMSINPQTMQDHVLRACGRPHSAQNVLESYRQAVEAGFENINMDLIAGLPKDTYEGFCNSLETVAELNPSNITVHTLALKKGADLFENPVDLPSQEAVKAMVEYANGFLREKGYKPYYLYRQKYMSGSFENVGWSKNGADCLYNIYMMEEVHTILSLGGGGMNKVNLPDGHLERFHNPKFPEQYISQLDSVLAQKEKLFQLL